MTIWARLYDFVAGTTISSTKVDNEFNQIIGALNQHTTDITAAQTNAINFTKNAGIGDTAKVINGTDLNNLDVTGEFYCTALTNAPNGLTAGVVSNKKINTTNRKQVFYDSTSDRTFERYQSSGTWQAWKQFRLQEPNVTANFGESLWTGLLSPLGSTSIVPSKKIDDCPNGWIIKWQNPTGTAYYSYTPIYKFSTRSSLTLLPCSHSTQMGGGAVNVPVKGVIISLDGTTLSGHDSNNLGTASARFMTEIFAF